MGFLVPRLLGEVERTGVYPQHLGNTVEVKGVLPTTPDQESIFRLQRGASGSRQSQDSQGPPPGEKPARCFVVSLGLGVAI